MLRAVAVAATLWAGATAADTSLPFALGGPFELVDQHGQARSQIDPDGHAQLLFFGYANCPGICATAMPMMAEVTDLLSERGITARPVMITVDPDRDRVGNMVEPLAAYHPDFIGLTGDDAALARAYKAFSVEKALAYVDPDYGPVYRHGSMVYLLDADGTVQTLLPPILGAERVADVAMGYLAPAN